MASTPAKQSSLPPMRPSINFLSGKNSDQSHTTSFAPSAIHYPSRSPYPDKALPNIENPEINNDFNKGLEKAHELEVISRPDQIAIYMDTSAGRCIRYRVNFNSPRTIEAAKELGITFEDCIKKYYFFILVY